MAFSKKLFPNNLMLLLFIISQIKVQRARNWKKIIPRSTNGGLDLEKIMSYHKHPSE
jgi:hypothetical protein